MPDNWTYLVVGDKLYIFDEDDKSKVYYVDGNKLVEVGAEQTAPPIPSPRHLEAIKRAKRWRPRDE